MKSLSSSTSHTARGSLPVLTFRVSAMLSLLQHHTYLYIFVVNSEHKVRFFHKWHITIDGIRAWTAWSKSQRCFHWVIQLKEITKQFFKSYSPRLSSRFDLCLGYVKPSSTPYIFVFILWIYLLLCMLTIHVNPIIRYVYQLKFSKFITCILGIFSNSTIWFGLCKVVQTTGFCTVSIFKPALCLRNLSKNECTVIVYTVLLQ